MKSGLAQREYSDAQNILGDFCTLLFHCMHLLQDLLPHQPLLLLPVLFLLHCLVCK